MMPSGTADDHANERANEPEGDTRRVEEGPPFPAELEPAPDWWWPGQ